MDKEVEVLILKLRNAIADKEFVNACAINDVAKFGEWQFNYNESFNHYNYIINEVLKDIELLEAKNKNSEKE